MWLKKYGERAYILNDDKPALRMIENSWYAFGTPWSGKNDVSVNTGVPLAGIAVLERNQDNEIERFNGLNAVRSIIKQVNRPSAMEYRQKLLELLDKLITQVPVWKLKCNMDVDAADVAYRNMCEEVPMNSMKGNEK